jgi:uncharacterized protein YjbJ (UPF0337 family)
VPAQKRSVLLTSEFRDRYPTAIPARAVWEPSQAVEADPTGRRERGRIVAEEREKLEGKAKEAIGKGREQLGKMTGNEKMEAEGQTQQGEGKGQQMAAGVKGKAKEAADQVKDKAEDLRD